MEYIDSIREGDGDPILNCWKFDFQSIKQIQVFCRSIQSSKQLSLHVF